MWFEKSFEKKKEFFLQRLFQRPGKAQAARHLILDNLLIRH